MADIGKQTPCKISKKPYYTIQSQYTFNEIDNVYICNNLKPEENLSHVEFSIFYDCLTQTRDNGILDIFSVKQYLDMYFDKDESYLYFEAIKELNIFIQNESKKKDNNTIDFNEKNKAKK